METKTDLREYLAGLKKARAEKKAALDNYNEAVARCKAAFVPIDRHPSQDGIQRLYERCPDGTQYARSYILVCLVLLRYAPDALFGGKLPLRLARMVAGVLGVKHEAVYIARNKVEAWLRLYPDFFTLVSGLFAGPDE